MAQYEKVKCPKTGKIQLTPIREKKAAPKKKVAPKAKTEE